MGFNFPASPITGQLYPVPVVAGLPQYRFDGEKWKTVVAMAATASVYVSDTPPVVPFDGMLWWESDTGLMYVRYFDGDSSQWVVVNIAGGITDMVRYGAAQTLTSAQKAQARSNIDVLKKNYIINGAMMVSQENGTTVGIASGYFLADQFFIGSVNGGAHNLSQVASTTPGGSPNRIRLTVTTADVSVAAGDGVYFSQKIEGLRVSDLLFGTASAKTITIQFGVKAPAGTYCVTVLNSATNRSYVSEYVISGGEANTDVVKSVTIAGDQSGTWLKDTGTGMEVRWGMMAGSTWQQAAGSWGVGNIFGTANQFNIMGTNGNVFELFDVSLTEGSVAPAFQVPEYASELIACKRHYQQFGPTAGGYPFAVGSALATTSASMMIPLSAPLRAVPTLTPLPAIGTAFLLYASASVPTAMSTAVNYLTDQSLRVDVTVASGLTVNQGVIALSAANGLIKLNARL